MSSSFTLAATTEIYTLSLHDALPIFRGAIGTGREEDRLRRLVAGAGDRERDLVALRHRRDRKSTRLNSSHLGISYAVFCLKKKTNLATRKTDQHRQRDSTTTTMRVVM